MARALAIAGNSANLGGAETCTDYPRTCTVSALQVAITDLIKFRNPHKTWAFVADLFGLKERAAKHRLANNSSYTIEELQALFQSEDGQLYFEAMMADATPEWWVWCKTVMATAEKRRIAAEANQEAMRLEAAMQPTAKSRRLIKGNADATKKLSAAFARKETALGLLRPESDRNLHRPLAQAKGGRR